MDNYQPDIYNVVLEELEPLIDKESLDKVSVSSMVRTAIEVTDSPLTSATRSVAYKGKFYTIKLGNIKINFQFILNIIFKFQSVLTQKELGLIMAIIDLVHFIFFSSTIEITPDLAIVLFAVYRIGSGDTNRIIDYVQNLDYQDHPKPNPDEIEKLLFTLVDMKCISCIDGQYKLNETIDYSMIDQFT